MSIESSNRKIDFSLKSELKTDKEGQRAEGQLAMFIAVHSSMAPVDHLNDVCKRIYSDSKATKNIKLRRTKCGQVIIQVLAPHFKEKLLLDIGDQKYSSIIDESTNVSVNKFLGIIIKYFSLSLNTVVSSFLGLIPIVNGDAKTIVESLVQCLEDCKIPLNNLVAIGTDNASVMTGTKGGVHEILKTQYNLPNLILIRCVCHSLQLAVSHSSLETLPRSIEFLVRETYNWFCVSPKRRQEYDNLYNTINVGEMPLKVLNVCDTRWLSIEPAIERILKQWEELKLHFTITKDKCKTADILSSMYYDHSYRIYFIYLKKILGHVRVAIKIFEGENSDPVQLLNTLMALLRTVSTIILLPNSAVSDNDFINIKIQSHLNPVPHLGHLFELNIAKCNLSSEIIRMIRRCSINFTIELAKEIQKRIPSNYSAFEKMSQLNRDETLKQNNDESIKDLASAIGFDDEKIDKILSQWKVIQFTKWNETKDTVNFWSEVAKYRDAGNFNPYQDFVDLALQVLSLPQSNAEVERLFSVMNNVQSKLRNRLAVETLNSIVMIRNRRKILKKCCHNYDLPDEVLNNVRKTIRKSKNINDAPSTSSSIDNTIYDDCEDHIDNIIHLDINIDSL